MPLPKALDARLAGLDSLSVVQRADLGRDLRRLGLSLSEISALVGRSKSTVSAWCKEVLLTEDQARAIAARTGARRGVPRDTQWRRRREIETIRAAARAEVPTLLSDPLWVAGTMLYWGEGTKTGNRLIFSNGDPRSHRVFIAWVEEFHVPSAEFVPFLSLHVGDDLESVQAFWRKELRLPAARFGKPFFKPIGTGQRKQTLPNGVCQTRVRRSSDLLHRTLAWIDELAVRLPTR